MDEGLLNDLLECSVCLERLDTSSRVLPCQHTFCLKCLKVIVESRKELRCPECRVLVETKIEELPPNVLLMRILEGMNTRKGAGGSQRAHRPHAYPQIPGQFQQTHDSKPVPPHARAIYDFISKEPGDLSFSKGETILLKKKLDAFWYQGECSGRTGMFPITYVQVVVPLPVAAALCKALYDFRMTAPDEEGCLAFDKGAIITVHRRVDDNWAEGRLDQRVGIFPLAFVELNVSARHVINSTPLNRPVPAIPEQARSGHSDMARHHAQLAHRYQQMSISTPATHANYQNVATMSQSHPNFQAQMQMSKALQQTVNQITSIPRNIIEPTQSKHSLDLIHFANVQNKSGTVLQSVSRNLENSIKVRKKFEFTPSQSQIQNQHHQNNENTYQNVRCDRFPASVANFNTNMSSDSSSSMNTPGISPSLNSTPNSSDTSTSESAEATPCSPENATTEREAPTTNVVEETNADNIESSRNMEPSRNTECSRTVEASPNTSMGVMSLNESSTATNTSLNVSLPSECSLTQLNSTTPNTSHNKDDNAEQRLEAACSSKQRPSGPDSLLTFGLGLQAALSPAHCKDYRVHRDPQYREKRHSLTPSTHLQGSHTPNRHSAEILATSLLDHTPERDRDSARPERERDRRRRRSRSNDRTLPATYVALYPYKPQKSDELELKKGGLYTVTERCRDGWFKGVSERSQRSGVFPGNYVAPISGARTRHDKMPSLPAVTAAASPVTSQPAVTAAASSQPAADPPLAPPRHSPQTGQPMSYPWSSQVQSQHATPKSDKSYKHKPDKQVSSGLTSSGVSLMKRLAAMKKCKSPPPAYSMDNPVFEDTCAPGPAPAPAQTQGQAHAHPHHVRSGSCPSQLLRSLPAAERRRVVTTAHAHRQIRTTTEASPWQTQTQHRKSQSLDVTTTRKEKHHTQPVKERFRCIVPYPPNSEYELELKVDDIVLVSKKRGDGWYKGTLQRTGRTGLFPASFVQSCPE